MATVWLAHDEELDRQVAIKVLSDVLAEDPAYTERFRREARVAAGLSDPNLVQVFDYSARSERPYIAMEHAVGGTLPNRVTEGTVDDLDSGRLARELLGALGAIHAAGDSPRRQALQRPPRSRRECTAHRFRDRPPRGRDGADRDRSGARDAEVHGSRGAGRQSGHRAIRCVRPGSGARGVPDRQGGATAQGPDQSAHCCRPAGAACLGDAGHGAAGDLWAAPHHGNGPAGRRVRLVGIEGDRGEREASNRRHRSPCNRRNPGRRGTRRRRLGPRAVRERSRHVGEAAYHDVHLHLAQHGHGDQQRGADHLNGLAALDGHGGEAPQEEKPPRRTNPRMSRLGRRRRTRAPRPPRRPGPHATHRTPRSRSPGPGSRGRSSRTA